MRQGSSEKPRTARFDSLTRPCHPLRSRAPFLMRLTVRLTRRFLADRPGQPPGGAVCRRCAACSPSDVQLDRAEHPFVPLDRHPQGGQEPLGRVEIHHDPLIGFDVLAAGCERLRIQAEVENHFLRGGRDPAEVRVGRKGRRIVDDNLGLLLGLGVLRGWTPLGASLPSFSLISGSEVS